MKLLQWLRGWLERPGWRTAVVLVGIVLVLPSVWSGRVMDDLFQQVQLDPRLETQWPVCDPPSLFCFFDHDPDRTLTLMESGIVPWWTDPDITISFWRPLAEWSHRLDYLLWPGWPSLMHLHQLLWRVALLIGGIWVYRRLFGPSWVAALAALMYAVDDIHGVSAGWLANRNGLMAAVFGVFAIGAFHLYCRERWKPGAFLAPVLFMGGLFCAEAGIATAAYLFAYTVFMDRGSIGARTLRLLPSTVVGVVWWLAYHLLGYGSSGSGLYIDPGRDPLRYLYACIERVPVMALSLVGGPPADLTLIAVDGILTPWALVGAMVLGAMVWLFLPLLRRSAEARFFATGAFLSIFPFCATFPMDRNLLFASLGARAVVALYLAGALESFEAEGAASHRLATRVLVFFLVATNLVLAPLSLPMSSLTMRLMGRQLEQTSGELPEGPGLEDKTLVIVNALDGSFSGYTLLARKVRGEPTPRRLWVLAVGQRGVEVRRVDSNTLLIRPDGGYLSDLFGGLFRDPLEPMDVGYQVTYDGLTIEVMEVTEDGRPAEVRFRFSMPLEDPSLLWRKRGEGKLLPFSDEKAFVAFELPEVGETVNLKGMW